MLTDKTPATEAGRRLLDELAVWEDEDSRSMPWETTREGILAIEAEAREGYISEDDCAASQRHSWDKAIAQARTEALDVLTREAVQAALVVLPPPPDMEAYAEAVTRRLRAILAARETP